MKYLTEISLTACLLTSACLPGPEGPVGPTGADGPMGADGPTGPTGAQGVTGSDGIEGSAGPVGETGPEGPPGPPGLVGPTGPEGPQGPLGPTGPAESVWGVDGANVYRAAGYVGIGLSAPGQRLHIGDGNILLEGGGQTGLIVKRDVNDNSFFDGPASPSPNPLFSIGRIERAGDGDPEIRVLYSDDLMQQNPIVEKRERSVFEFDRKGIVASVKPDVGSHFEGFVKNDAVDDHEPRFRLNSYPSMQLEMGPGGVQPTDVAIRREAGPTLTFLTSDAERLTVTSEDVSVSDQVYLRLSTVLGGAPPASDCSSPAHAGRMQVRTDGPPDLYVCNGTAWIGK